MANPQVENGFIKIANEVMEALARIRIPGEVRQIVDTVIRKTYGFNKKQDVISLSQFCNATGLKKPTCCRAIKKALEMNLIIKNDNGNIASYSFNKNFDTWKPLPKKITVIKNDNKSLSKMIPTKYNNTKYNNKNTDPRIKRIIDYFHSVTLERKNIKPLIRKKDASVVKGILKDISEDEAKEIINFYLESEKFKKHGPTLSVALSTHTVNLYRQYKETNRWRYEG